MIGRQAIPAPHPRLASFESLAGLTALASLYAGAFGGVRLALQLSTLLLVAACVLRNRHATLGFANSGPMRGVGLAALVAALSGFFVSTLVALVTRGLAVNDFGVFILQTLLPTLVLASRTRLQIARAIGTWAIAFALLDAAANALALAGIVDIVAPSRIVAGQVQFAYPGLSGSTLGAGFVAFAACCMLLDLAHRYPARRLLASAVFGIVGASLYLSTARRYLGLVLVALLLFRFWRQILRIGLPVVALSVAAFFLYLTFAAPDDDGGNVLRALLMLNGLARAASFPFIGNGPTYFQLTEATATFAELSEIGITESQLLELAISYGVASAALFCLAIGLALAAQRQRVPAFTAVVLTTMGAELFFGGSLSGFAGTLLFYGCLGTCLEAEPTVRTTNGPVRSIGQAKPA